MILDIVKESFFASQNYPQEFQCLDSVEINSQKSQWDINRERYNHEYRFREKFKLENWEDYINYAEAAQNSNTSIDLLEKLAKDNNKYIRSCVAKNPNLSFELYQQLALDKQKLVRTQVAKNIYTPASILELLAQPKYGVRHKIAQNPSTPQFILIELSKNKHISVNRQLAGNPNTPDFILRKLFQIQDRQIKYQLAKNPSIPLDISRKLIKNECSKIRSNLASNYGITPDILLYLIRKENSEQQANLNSIIALHPNANEDVLYELAKICSSYTGYYILFRHNCTLKVIKQLFNNLLNNQESIGYGSLKKLAVLFDSNTKASVLKSHADSIFWLEKYAIANNPNTPQKTKILLERDSNILVRNAVSRASHNPLYFNY